MDELTPRLRAVCDLGIAMVREGSGRHEYDGRIQDLSPNGVRNDLTRLGDGAGARAGDPGRRSGGEHAVSGDADAGAAVDALDDPHDEAHLATFERHTRVVFDELELHRRNPLMHIEAMDLAGYDREYAPEGERAHARLTQLAAWPQAVNAAIAALDRCSAPVAVAVLPAAAGLAAGIPRDADTSLREAAVAAHARLVDHIARVATDGAEDAALGDGLTRLMSSADGMDVDLGRLAEQADAERDRLHTLLAEGCARIDASRPSLDVARELVRDHPDGDGAVEAARYWTQRAIEFTRDHDLVPYHDGECRVGLAPESRRWAMAMMTWAAPGEPDSASWYHITPPDPSWPEHEVNAWLEVFSATTLPSITVHEVAPGHFSHGRALRRAPSQVRRILYSGAFVEGWAHYAEEVCVEEGFCADDPRFAIGVWLDALVRVTRLACAIGIHTGGMSVQEGARRFAGDTALTGQAALAEAQRATYDPTYGRYTWGKLEIMALRERARKEWGAGFTLSRFHTSMLDLGAPPLGLLDTALKRG